MQQGPALPAPMQQDPALPAPVRQGPVGDALPAFIGARLTRAHSADHLDEQWLAWA